MKRKLLIFGCGNYAELMWWYFKHDSNYHVAAFVVDPEYKKKNELRGLPLIASDTLAHYPPSDYDMYVALVYNKLNRCREDIYDRMKALGYKMASYINSRVFIPNGCSIGEHSVIMEDNTIQPFSSIGNNCILWSGNHIGHETKVDDNCFISSHVVISGSCHIERNCFLGVNSTFGNGVVLGGFSWVSPGAIITKDVPPRSLVKSAQSEFVPLDEEALSRALARAKK